MRWRRGARTRAPGFPRTRRTPRVWPQLGSGPCSQPAVARSSASRFESVLAGGGSVESETWRGQTDKRETRQTRRDKSRTKKSRDFLFFVFSWHARKEMRKPGVMAQDERREKGEKHPRGGEPGLRLLAKV